MVALESADAAVTLKFLQISLKTKRARLSTLTAPAALTLGRLEPDGTIRTLERLSVDDFVVRESRQLQSNSTSCHNVRNC
jgi:hypothetical protein